MIGKIVVIASSTGGPAALMQILPYLPKDFPYPVVVVQHIWPGFAGSLKDSIKEKCLLPVLAAGEGKQVEAGIIYVAPSEYHLMIKKTAACHIFSFAGEDVKRSSARPSADILFESLGNCGYSDVLAVVLTGMGSDGTEGILSLSSKKKVTVYAQDEESCVVYGMPAAVAEKFEGCEVVKLGEMAERIMEFAGGLT